ncbi:MAG TPA: hypothetical protein ENK91_09440 [Bacteroidetes bacterium]|nr:hypothetical protein [Bacteroidota bacterium]
MKKRILFITILLIYSTILSAQIQKLFSENIDSNWFFGQYVGINKHAIVVEAQTYTQYQQDYNNPVPLYFYKEKQNNWKYDYMKNVDILNVPSIVWGDFQIEYNDNYFLYSKGNKEDKLWADLTVEEVNSGNFELIKKFEFDSFYHIVTFVINNEWLFYRLSKSIRDTSFYLDYFYKIQNNDFILVDSFIYKDTLIFPGIPSTIKSNITDKYTIIGDASYNYKERKSGRVTIYKRKGENWEFSQNIYHPEILHNGNALGMGTAITEDNKYLFVSAMYSQDKVPKVYIYKNTNGMFELYDELTEPEAVAGNHYGNSISYQNGVLLVGNYQIFKECVVFQYGLENDKWVRKAKIKPPQGMKSDFFGVSIAQYGETVVVGASFDNTYHVDNGAAYIFQIPARDTLTAGICEGEGYTFNDTVIYDAGHYTDTLLASYGVDSVVQLYLTVYPKEQVEIDTILCDDESLMVGDSLLTEEGVYTLNLKNIHGCDSIVTARIEYDNLEVSDSITADYGCQNGEINITLQGNNPPYAFKWNTGDSSEDISGLSKGEYSVTITSESGCEYDYEYQVGDSIPYLIPNAFFPSGQEEINSTFKPYTAKDVHILSTQIYDRWGEKVFSGTEDEYWDGTYHGKASPPGVYLYRMEIESPCGKEVKTGQVVLMR